MVSYGLIDSKILRKLSITRGNDDELHFICKQILCKFGNLHSLLQGQLRGNPSHWLMKKVAMGRLRCVNYILLL